MGKGEAGQEKGSLAITESSFGNGLCGTHCGHSVALKSQLALNEWWLGHEVGSCAGAELPGSGSPQLQEAGSQQVCPCPHQQVASQDSYGAAQNPDFALKSSPSWASWGRSEASLFYEHHAV